MKNYKIGAILYYAAAICWFIASVINFTSDRNIRGFAYLILFALSIACGSLALNKYNKYNNEKGKDEQEEKEQNKSED